jgi:hypothetical protein
MPLVVVPNFPATPKPSIADVRAVETSILAAIGGSLEGVAHPGALNGDNIAAAAGFQLSQVAEPRSRVVLHQSGSANALKPIVCVPFDLEVDTLLVWQSSADTLIGKIAVLVNGALAAELPVEAGGIAQGAVHEFRLALALGASDILQVKCVNGTDYLTKGDGTQPAASTEAYVTLLGVATHVA